MLKFIPRCEKSADYTKQLWQACDPGFGIPQFISRTGALISDNNCYYCRYRDTWSTQEEYFACSKKHGCDNGQFPFILMSVPFEGDVEQSHENPDHTIFDYNPTGIYRQVEFEAVPLYVQLYVATKAQASCNASCWYHAQRLDKKQTWRQCGKSHLCQNNGSAWVLMIPTDEDIRELFYEQF